MSFLAKTPQVPQSAMQEGSQVSTYREAETVPHGYGGDRYVSHWLSDKYDKKTRPTEKNKPDMEMCSIAAGYRSGPIDYVGKVWRDGKLVAELDFAFSEHGEPESQEFTIPALGASTRAIVHRGTVDAPTSIVANLIAQTSQTHPPYRRQAWIEWIDLDLGQGSAALPDLQVEMRKYTPAIGDFGVSQFGAWGVNPFAAIYALLTDEAGFGVDPAYFDTADWAAQCAALETIGISARTSYLTFCNPVFKSAQEAASMLSAILAHVDGFIYVDGGRFRIGWFPSQAPDVESLPEISEHDLDGVPSGGNFPDWNRGAASVVVIYRDRDRNYGDTPALCPAPANRENSIVANPVPANRPMIHVNAVEGFPEIPPQAALIAAEISASKGSSESTISLPVQKSRAVKGDGSPLMPGDLFVWDYAPHSLDLVVRVVGRRMRSGQASDLLEVIPERGQYPLPYVPAFEPRVLPSDAPPGEIDVTDVRLWLLPTGLSETRKLAPLVDRAHRGIYRADLHLSTAGVAPWDVILDSRFFIAKCAVTNGGINDVAATVRITSTSVDFVRMAAQNAVAQVDDTLCILIGDELCSVGTVTAVALNTYDLSILRGVRNTTAAAHADAAVAWLFVREELLANCVEHVEFYRVRDVSNIYDAGIATKHFKLQLFTIAEDGLAKPDDPGIALTLPDLSADETLGYTIVLSNEAHTVACAADGTVNAGQLGVAGTAKSTVAVYRGSTLLTLVAAGPNSDQFSIALGTLTNATATKESNDTVRCDTLTADTGTIEILVSVAGAFVISKIFTLTKAKTGATGTSGNFVDYVFKRSAAAPATPTGNTPAGWSDGPPAGTDPLWMSTADKTAANVLIGVWSTPVRLDGNNIQTEYSIDGATSWHSVFASGDIYMRVSTDGGTTWSAAMRIIGEAGVAGTRGSKSFYAATTGTAWSNTEADAAITAAGLTKVLLDTVTLYKTSAGYSETRYWDGAAWQVVAQVIDGNLIVHGTIGTNHLVVSIGITSPVITGGTITGASLIINSGLGLSYYTNAGVYTITGGTANGVQYGAQFDLQGTDAGGSGAGGAAVIQAGNGTNGRVIIRTSYGGTTGGADYGLDRVTVAVNGDVSIARNLAVALTLDAPTIETTGITTGSGSSQRKVLARQPIYAVLNVAGGAATETIDFSLTNFGFSTRPDSGWMQSADWDRLLIRYDADDSTSTYAKLRLSMSDGSNLPTLGTMEATGEFVEYD